MSDYHGTDVLRRGLDSEFAADEARKSRLIIDGQQLRQEHREEAAGCFAAAAEIEERLSQGCEWKGLLDKAFIHRFSTASCWAQAGNFYRALSLSDDLLARPEL